MAIHIPIQIVSRLSKLLSSFTQLAATTPVIVDSAVTVNLSSCGDTKGCFRHPTNCTGADDCTAVVTWTPRTDDTQTYIEFELQGTDNWVALGLSYDNLMVGA